jgi:hypothetical protein
MRFGAFVFLLFPFVSFVLKFLPEPESATRRLPVRVYIA